MESKDKNSNIYKLKQEDKEYIFITTIVGDSIRLSCENSSEKKFIHDFSISALKSLNKIFDKVETTNQAIEIFDKILKDHKVAVVEENQALKLVFYITEKETINRMETSLENGAKETKDVPVENITNENLENYQTNINTENYGEIQNYIPDSTYVGNYGETNYINYGETQTYTTTNYTSDQNIISELVRDPNEIITSTDNYNYNIDTNNYLDTNQYIGDNIITTTTTDYQTYPTTTSYQQESYQIPETNTYVDTSSYPYTTDTGFIQGETYNTSSDITYQTQDYTNYQTQDYITTTNYQTEEYSTTNYETQTPIEGFETTPITTNTDYITETPINFPETTTTTTTTEEALHQTAMSTSVALPPENYVNTQEIQTTTQSLELPLIEEACTEKIKLENEISNLKAENDAYKQKLIELNGIQTEAAEAKVLKKQVDEITSLKAQLAELDTLRAKLSELDLLKAEINKINSMKEKMEEFKQ